MIETMFLAILYLIGVIASYYMPSIYSGIDIGVDRWLYVLAWPVVMVWIGLAGIWSWMVGRRG